LWYATARGLGEIYWMAHAVPPFSILPNGLGGLLIAIGSLSAAFAPSMIVANCLVWLVPAARRTFEAEAEPFPDLTFRSANQGFLRMTTLMTPIGLAIGMLGALLP